MSGKMPVVSNWPITRESIWWCVCVWGGASQACTAQTRSFLTQQTFIVHVLNLEIIIWLLWKTWFSATEPQPPALPVGVFSFLRWRPWPAGGRCTFHTCVSSANHTAVYRSIPAVGGDASAASTSCLWLFLGLGVKLTTRKSIVKF